MITSLPSSSFNSSGGSEICLSTFASVGGEALGGGAPKIGVFSDGTGKAFVAGILPWTAFGTGCGAGAPLLGFAGTGGCGAGAPVLGFAGTG